MSLIQNFRKQRRPVLAGLVVVFYLLTAAIVPPGHMAAPLGSGTAFHLCPGDARSSLIIDALAAASKAANHHGHHGKHQSPHTSDHGNHDSGISETSADAGCVFAGVGGALAASADYSSEEQLAPPALSRREVSASYRSSTWLRPPVRSPPV